MKEKNSNLNEKEIQIVRNLINSGKMVDAENRTNQLLEKNPNSHILLNILGVSLVNQNKLDEAVNIYLQIRNTKPDFAEAHNNLGNIYIKLGKIEESISCFEDAIKIKPNFAQAYNNLAVALQKQKKFEEAIKNCNKAIEVMPNYFEAYNNLGAIFKDSGNLKKAIESCEKAIKIKPEYVEAYNNLGIALREIGKTNEAIENYQEAIKIKPNYAEAHNHLGNALMDVGKIYEAIESYKKALNCKSDSTANLNNLEHLGLDDGILKNYKKIINPQQYYPSATFNESLARLTLGEFENGWKKYEFRWFVKNPSTKLRHQKIPFWNGSEKLNNKKILIWAEQGFGDVVQFSRYINLILNLGAKITFEVPENLKTLMSQISENCNVVTIGKLNKEYDFQAPLMSLPMIFNTTLKTIPKKIPYLNIPSSLIEHWSKFLGAKKKKRIGLAWSGRKTYKDDKFRSIKLNLLLPLINSNFEYFCLQKDIRDEDKEDLKKSSIKYLGDNDFLNTAAIIKNLDLVITSDTVVPHLSGAINFPTWMLLPFNADWRWLLNFNYSPWYPSLKIFRQKKINDWNSVVKIISDEMKFLDKI